MSKYFRIKLNDYIFFYICEIMPVEESEKKVPVTTHLYQRQIDHLNRVAKELQVTKAVLFREAIEQLLKRYEEKQLDIGIK